jgi:Tfp pilus assembly protein PilO
MDFSFKDRTIRVIAKIVIVIFSLVLIYVGGQKLALTPMVKAKKRLEEVQKNLKDIEVLVKDNPDPKKKIEDIKTRIDDLDKKSVTEKDIAKGMKILTQKSAGMNVEIVAVKPIKEKELTFKDSNVPAGIAKTYMEVSCKATYKDLAEYIKAIKDMPVTFTIEGIIIDKISEDEELNKKKKEEGGKVMAVMLISSYSLK